MGNFKYSLLCDIFNLEKTLFPKCASEMGDSEMISLLNLRKLIKILQGQGKNSKVDQIGTMNAGIGLCEDGFDPEVHRSQSRMLPARTLSIIFSPNHKSTAPLLCPLSKMGIYPFKEVFRNRRDIGSEMKNLCSSREDIVG